MSHNQPAFPFFLPIPVRALTNEELAVVTRLMDGAAPEYRTQVANLQVVGQCGCAKCPTVFFEPWVQGDQENDLVTFEGRDKTGGLVAAVLLQKNGRLSQLEFYSVDGHEPWFIPEAKRLEPIA